MDQHGAAAAAGQRPAIELSRAIAAIHDVSHQTSTSGLFSVQFYAKTSLA